MGRIEDLETEIGKKQEQMDEAIALNRKDDIEKIQSEIDGITCQLNSLSDVHVERDSYADTNEEP